MKDFLGDTINEESEYEVKSNKIFFGGEDNYAVYTLSEDGRTITWTELVSGTTDDEDTLYVLKEYCPLTLEKIS